MAYQSKFKKDDIDELFKAVLLLEDEEDSCCIDVFYQIEYLQPVFEWLVVDHHQE